MELAWAAGLFDGEGCTSLRGNSLRLSICQYHPEVLERFQAAVGVGKIYQTQHRGNTQWQFMVSTKAAIVVLGQIWPYLSSPKREQALSKLSMLQ